MLPRRSLQLAAGAGHCHWRGGGRAARLPAETPYEEVLHYVAEQCNARLELLHVYDWSAVYASGMGFGVLPVATGLDHIMGENEKDAFEALADRHGVPVDCRHFIEGVPVPTICVFAMEHLTDVIVMGTVQHSGLDKLLSSTAEHLLHRAPCSVLAIKPPGDE